MVARGIFLNVHTYNDKALGSSESKLPEEKIPTTLE